MTLSIVLSFQLWRRWWWTLWQKLRDLLRIPSVLCGFGAQQLCRTFRRVCLERKRGDALIMLLRLPWFQGRSLYPFSSFVLYDRRLPSTSCTEWTIRGCLLRQQKPTEMCTQGFIRAGSVKVRRHHGTTVNVPLWGLIANQEGDPNGIQTAVFRTLCM